MPASTPPFLRRMAWISSTDPIFRARLDTARSASPTRFVLPTTNPDGRAIATDPLGSVCTIPTSRLPPGRSTALLPRNVLKRRNRRLQRPDPLVGHLRAVEADV